jgi:hypothetical protein
MEYDRGQASFISGSKQRDRMVVSRQHVQRRLPGIGGQVQKRTLVRPFNVGVVTDTQNRHSARGKPLLIA